jgi:hypothetical protein
MPLGVSNEMSAMISQVANVRVRSVGTLGFADPRSDLASFLMVTVTAQITVRGPAVAQARPAHGEAFAAA